jgi:NAD(P)-dependent dehydrogenase (short-subunit alcohol dehydrogenase family)
MERTVAELKFNDRVVLITGGGRGMGRTHSEYFAARGAKVVVSDFGGSMAGTGTDTSVAQEVVDAIRAAGGEATAYTESLATEAGARGAIKCALDTYGRIDTVVHNAGITLGAMPCENEVMDRLERLIAINTGAAYAMLIEMWPAMQRQKYGRIVLIGSTAMYGIPMNISYSSAKASYLGMVRSVACEGEKLGIKANLVGPSGNSRMSENMPDSEFKRWFRATMKPELVSAVVALLGHEKCPVNGETFAVAGGRVARVLMAETKGFIKKDLTPEDVLAHMDDIMDTKTVTPFKDYSDSAVVLMNALGFKPTEPVGMVSGAVPK